MEHFLTLGFIRNCHCLLPHRCQLRLQIPPSPPLAEWSIKERHSLSRILRTIRFRTHNHYSHPKAITAVLANRVYTLHPLLMAVVLEEGHHILQTGSRWVLHPMATALEFFLHQTQRLEAACQKRIRTLRFS
jgi:hypothetical protein